VKDTSEVEVEVATVRGDPGKGPAHPLPRCLDLRDRRPRNRGEGEVRLLEMLPRRIDVVGDEGAAGADVGRVRRQHEVVDRKLTAAAEEIAERHLALRSLEGVGLLDPYPGHLAALGAQRVEPVGHVALAGEKRLPRLEPFRR
jgi:hypothetical protein